MEYSREQNSTDDEITSWLIERVQIQGQRDTIHFELIIPVYDADD